MDKVDLKHIKPYTAKHNKLISTCPECDADLLLDDDKHGNVYDNCYGFANTSNGNMMMVECPVCFHKWSFHSGMPMTTMHYTCFLDSIEEGTNKHYKNGQKSKIR